MNGMTRVQSRKQGKHVLTLKSHRNNCYKRTTIVNDSLDFINSPGTSILCFVYSAMIYYEKTQRRLDCVFFICPQPNWKNSLFYEIVIVMLHYLFLLLTCFLQKWNRLYLLAVFSGVLFQASTKSQTIL